MRTGAGTSCLRVRVRVAHKHDHRFVNGPRTVKVANHIWPHLGDSGRVRSCHEALTLLGSVQLKWFRVGARISDLSVELSV